MRLPFFVWAQFITAFLLLLAFPPLEAAGILQLMDRVLETSFFLPTGLVVSGMDVDVSGGGSPLLWQHLFWFLAHPEVYVLVLPGMGIVAEVISNNTRKPIWGYKYLVGAVVVLGFLAFKVSIVQATTSTLILLVSLSGSLYGLSDEFHQSFVPGRSSDSLDLLADSLGAFCGGLFALWVSNRWPRRRGAPGESTHSP